MSTFPASDLEVTHILVVADLDRARTWYRDVLGATVTAEYGGTSVVLRLGPETRCFFRDPDGHLFEISEYRN